MRARLAVAILFLALIVHAKCHGQITNNGVEITVKASTDIYVNGDYSNSSNSTALLTLNDATSVLNLKGNLINDNSSQPTVLGTISFNGTTQAIGGAAALAITNVTLNGNVSLQ